MNLALFSSRSFTVLFLTVFGTQASNAASFEEWSKSAWEVIFQYEGSSLGKVTDDFDCQGLSLGGKQYPIQNGSIKTLISAVEPKALDASILEYMPTTNEIFQKIVDLVREDRFAEARIESLRIQQESTGCPPGSTGPKGNKINGISEKEISAWLVSPLISEAQERLGKALADDALKLAYCWKTQDGDGPPLHFSEFLFFLDFLTQAGPAGLRDDVFNNVVKLIKNYKQYGITKEDQIKDKSKYIQQWLMTNWTVAANSSFLTDAKFNATVVMESLNSIDALQLIYIRYLRAMVGNTRYAVVLMNRGIIDIFGYGRVNKTKYDFRALFSSMGFIFPEWVADISCSN